jgi:hypothetical protein
MARVIVRDRVRSITCLGERTFIEGKWESRSRGEFGARATGTSAILVISAFWPPNNFDLHSRRIWTVKQHDDYPDVCSHFINS